MGATKRCRLGVLLLLLNTSQYSSAFVGWTNRWHRPTSHANAATSETREPSPIPPEWQSVVLQQLKSVIDPDLGRDIVTLGFVQNLKLQDRTVSFDVELTTPACPVKAVFAADCERLVLALPFVDIVEVTMTAQDASNQNTGPMSQVGAVIAVSSCKGGVGKSTTAVNLAYALQSLGATVGIFDADLYGPSLPTMIKPDDDLVRFVGRQIAPLQRNGVRLMSFGYVNEGSAVMRGPMVTQLLDQFLAVTAWGKLDYLVVDMPPGTGDIQLTLTQRLNITAAVVVTTPAELAFADVVRGVEMFDAVDVPCVAVVENMAYYEIETKTSGASDPAHFLDSVDQINRLKQAMAIKLKEQRGRELLNGRSTADALADELVQIVLAQQQGEKSARGAQTTERIQIFGPGHKQRLTEQWGIEHSFSVPLLQQIAANGDKGTPYVLEYPDSEPTKIYIQLAKAVVSEIAKAKYSTLSSSRPTIVYDKDRHVLTVDDDELAPATLRRACRCASCVEEMTGRQILVPSQVSDAVAPVKMGATGNYAWSVDWSDGHRSLFPYRLIRGLLHDQKLSSAAAPTEMARVA
jgi:Mrp family chromosome partitioning ATPase/DUF971 family protein